MRLRARSIDKAQKKKPSFIPIHSEMGASQSKGSKETVVSNGTPRLTRSYSRQEHPYIHFHTLNSDVVYEIFSYYLSGICPLQIILRLPINDWVPLAPLLPRCQNIFIEIPEYMSGREVTDATQLLLAADEFPQGCELHWYRAGAVLEREGRDSNLGPMPNVAVLELDADGSEHTNYRRYAINRDIRYLERADSYSPLILLKTFNVLDILQNTSSLTTLEISHYALDPISSDIELPMVYLTMLRELEIRDIDSEKRGSLIPFMESIKCPNIVYFSMARDYTDIWNLTEYIRTIGSPTSLIIRVQGERIMLVNEASTLHSPPFSVTFMQILVEDFNKNMNTDTRISEYISTYTRSFPGALEIRLVLESRQYIRAVRGTRPLFSIHWLSLRRFIIYNGPQDGLLPLLEYTKSPNTALTVISGRSMFVYEFASIFGIIGGLRFKSEGSKNTDEFPTGIKFVRFMRLRFSTSDLANPTQLANTLEEFERHSHPYTVVLYLLPSIKDYPVFAALNPIRHNIKIFCIETEGVEETLSLNSISAHPHDIFSVSVSVRSIIFARFGIHHYGQLHPVLRFSDNAILNNLLDQGMICALRSVDHESTGLEADRLIPGHWMPSGDNEIGNTNYANLSKALNFTGENNYNKWALKGPVTLQCIHQMENSCGYRRLGLRERSMDQLPAPMICLLEPVTISPQPLVFPKINTITKLDIRPRRNSLENGIKLVEYLYGDFPLLTSLACPPGMVLPLLSRNKFPHLHTLQIRLPYMGPDAQFEIELQHFDASYADWLFDHIDLFPKLVNFGFQWFPRWSSLLPLLRFYSRPFRIGYNMTKVHLTLKLPAIPAPHILQEVVWAMAGGESSEPELSYTAPSQSLCYFCTLSGLGCAWQSGESGEMYSGMYCGNYSLEDLTVITKDTLTRALSEIWPELHSQVKPVLSSEDTLATAKFAMIEFLTID
ncbi:hypothetical protein M408DRAFT_9313 [Serendipita vermifera MAFF 305830]|uniref:Uncharacterized protein n=1 Tax=Serendipita vermifera MAFF 305830 TaxID=933852 RepID=A0A0C3ARZ7_SERVB|nr:hypothetical protein M408DRAFT_9313 [Serendipita vermifera MAFF 305830]